MIYITVYVCVCEYKYFKYTMIFHGPPCLKIMHATVKKNIKLKNYLYI